MFKRLNKRALPTRLVHFGRFAFLAENSRKSMGDHPPPCAIGV